MKKICPRCGNTDRSWFYKGSKGWYCRKCISFGRAMLQEDLEINELQPVREGAEEYLFKYPLTALQKEISAQCMQKIRDTDVLLQCVCGAGKTEMTIETIAMFLKERKKVCFAIARRQVVLEVAERLQSYFPKASVIAVCGGHTQFTDGDLIVCTTHQLYRYAGTPGAFDLLILDEPDAFPFKGDEVLHGIADHACRGHRIYLTATPDDELLNRVEKGSLHKLVLNQRPHGKPIPVPRIHTAPFPVLMLYLIRWIRKFEGYPRMIFVPSIRTAVRMHFFLHFLFPCSVCTSKTENRDEVIEAFRREPNGIMIATTVLERGVTVPHAQVCIFQADSSVFDEAGLIQMAGRAGRSFDDPYGDVLFLCEERSDLACRCRKSLQEANASCAV